MTHRFGLSVLVCAALLMSACDKWGYSEEVKANYVKHCNATNTEVMKQVCECSFEEIKKAMPYKEFKAMDDAVKNNTVPKPESLGAVADAMKTCSQKIFLSGQEGNKKQ